jgi:predicted DNA-binding protein
MNAPHEPNERTSVLTSAPSETEAAIIIEALESEGIRAESDAFTSGLRAGPWNWVTIMVAEDDLARAKEVLERVKEENENIDWSQVDVGEPEDE